MPPPWPLIYRPYACDPLVSLLPRWWRSPPLISPRGPARFWTICTPCRRSRPCRRWSPPRCSSCCCCSTNLAACRPPTSSRGRRRRRSSATRTRRCVKMSSERASSSRMTARSRTPPAPLWSCCTGWRTCRRPGSPTTSSPRCRPLAGRRTPRSLSGLSTASAGWWRTAIDQESRQGRIKAANYRRQHAGALLDCPAAAEEGRHEDDRADGDEEDGGQPQVVLVRDEVLDVIVFKLEEDAQGEQAGAGDLQIDALNWVGSNWRDYSAAFSRIHRKRPKSVGPVWKRRRKGRGRDDKYKLTVSAPISTAQSPAS